MSYELKCLLVESPSTLRALTYLLHELWGRFMWSRFALFPLWCTPISELLEGVEFGGKIYPRYKIIIIIIIFQSTFCHLKLCLTTFLHKRSSSTACSFFFSAAGLLCCCNCIPAGLFCNQDVNPISGVVVHVAPCDLLLVETFNGGDRI